MYDLFTIFRFAVNVLMKYDLAMYDVRFIYEGPLCGLCTIVLSSFNSFVNPSYFVHLSFVHYFFPRTSVLRPLFIITVQGRIRFLPTDDNARYV